jgi:hypothetical protein
MLLPPWDTYIHARYENGDMIVIRGDGVVDFDWDQIRRVLNKGQPQTAEENERTVWVIAKIADAARKEGAK